MVSIFEVLNHLQELSETIAQENSKIRKALTDLRSNDDRTTIILQMYMHIIQENNKKLIAIKQVLDCLDPSPA